MPRRLRCLKLTHVYAQAFVAGLHKNGQRWVPILDPAIHVLPGYAPYDTGIAQDVFIKDITGQPYVGEVSLPGKSLSLIPRLVAVSLLE